MYKRQNPLLSYLLKIVRNISLKIYWRKEAAKRSSHYTIALEEIEACIAAVSYTHLDVYKRQPSIPAASEVPVMNTEQHVQSANYSIQKAARDVLV